MCRKRKCGGSKRSSLKLKKSLKKRKLNQKVDYNLKGELMILIALIELNKTLLEQEAEIERLTEECSSMSQKLSKDPEFIRFVDTVYAISNQAVHLTQEF